MIWKKGSRNQDWEKGVGTKVVWEQGVRTRLVWERGGGGRNQNEMGPDRNLDSMGSSER